MMKSALIVMGIVLSLAVVYILIRIVLVAIIVYADTLKRKGFRK